MERWLKSPWNQPNNGETLFRMEQHQQALRAAYDLRKTDPEEYFQAFLGFAEQGSAWSMYYVAYSLSNGVGTPVNLLEGEKWLRRGYEVGDERAMLGLANEYLRQKRYSEAEGLLQGYAQKDYAPALYLLGYVFLRQGYKSQARLMLERASGLGHRRAKASLANLCLRGKFGIRSIPYGFQLANEIGDEVNSGDRAASAKVEAIENETASL
jgi:TPR repeat protein